MRDVVVDVWRVPAAAVDPAVVALLTDAERDRAAALAPAVAPAFVAGRALLRTVVGARLGVAPAAVPLDVTCPACGGPHGPVHVPGAARGTGADVHVSLTRSTGLVAVALTASVPVGVDVEEVRAVRPALADVALAPAERADVDHRLPGRRRRALARAWVRKEAVVKALGTGLVTAPADVVVVADAAAGGFRVRHAGADVLGVDVLGADVGAGRGRVGAVAVVADGPARVSVRVHDGAAVLRATSSPA